MNFFGIGGPELIIIAVAALIIFGPGKLPEVAGQAGRAVRDFRRMTTDLTGEFEKTLNESGAGELRNTVNKELKGMRGQVENVGKSVERDLNKSKGNKTGSSGVKAASKGPGTGSRAGSSVKKAAGKAGTTGSSSARVAASGTSTPAKSKTAMAKPVASAPAEIKATKDNPLADVSLMDDDQETDTAPTRSDLIAPGSGPKRTATDHSGPPNPAISRARERRNSAGYSRARA